MQQPGEFLQLLMDQGEHFVSALCVGRRHGATAIIVAKPFVLLTFTKCIKRESYSHRLRVSECSTFDYNSCFCHGLFLSILGSKKRLSLRA
ncbi:MULTISPECIES: hypothetical protein [Pseudomonas]|uniref:Uncharacterized protein n=1 Tax=Pseudomonas oryzihabitans TaxID=47885 RepID=A0A178LMI3_9PSED|nr:MULTISPECIES: hypothetical protein [Pseudomonas]NMY91698.1 hypothetical protein [Pseudomonas psychrotolerans]NMY92089.1 hypothetical protein [Pseudomonas psychrotolerans]NRH44539.1 hypothetical protein [Pseudomonas sp. MS15a(2019)]OAN31736.1 hypothetical protein A4V15_11790 [Pseudomonas oryzihabitans]SCZ48699.1 hypothetical protein SAMN05216279_13026 [Pseudomonas psychrotolerans]